MRTYKFITAAAATVIFTGAGSWAKSASDGDAFAPLASPLGVTFQVITVGEGVVVPGSSSSRAGSQSIFANAEGLTLYYSDKDPTGKSLCTGPCTETWRPFVAAAGAQPVGDWSVIAHPDGGKQWAYKDKPLYTNVNDKEMGQSEGNGAEDETWHAASLQPQNAMLIPAGIGVSNVADANGHALVDERGMPLYAFNGNVLREAPDPCGPKVCLDKWVPFAAPFLGRDLGAFTVIERPDGIRQWAFKGRPLYTFTGDVELGDATGRGIDERIQTALVARYFQPAGVEVRSNAQHGGYLATTDGKTLYARDTIKYMGLGNHAARGGAKGVPDVGKSIGTQGCEGPCLDRWTPLAAPADAQPWGDWSVLTRDDGSKQWAYQSYALYSYAGDTDPGDINGNDVYDLFVVNEDTSNLAPSSFRFGLYWRVATQ